MESKDVIMLTTASNNHSLPKCISHFLGALLFVMSTFTSLFLQQELSVPSPKKYLRREANDLNKSTYALSKWYLIKQ